jgi:hypothetical protein
MLAAERHLTVLAFLTPSPIPALQATAAMLLPCAAGIVSGRGERAVAIGVRADGALVRLAAAEERR